MRSLLLVLVRLAGAAFEEKIMSDIEAIPPSPTAQDWARAYRDRHDAFRATRAELHPSSHGRLRLLELRKHEPSAASVLREYIDERVVPLDALDPEQVRVGLERLADAAASLRECWRYLHPQTTLDWSEAVDEVHRWLARERAGVVPHPGRGPAPYGVLRAQLANWMTMLAPGSVAAAPDPDNTPTTVPSHNASAPPSANARRGVERRLRDLVLETHASGLPRDRHGETVNLHGDDAVAELLLLGPSEVARLVSTEKDRPIAKQSIDGHPDYRAFFKASRTANGLSGESVMERDVLRRAALLWANGMERDDALRTARNNVSELKRAVERTRAAVEAGELGGLAWDG